MRLSVKISCWEHENRLVLVLIFLYCLARFVSQIWILKSCIMFFCHAAAKGKARGLQLSTKEAIVQAGIEMEQDLQADDAVSLSEESREMKVLIVRMRRT
ncbi:hypothetical protein A2U01_0000985 [Trifolium medium]|uniref:Uncharacterized protein n=1 Tax=Trifolium medium TaxID=97028 RepID=A0A392LYZ3_9FABA|nr:hypothetical protein [Trifolium medium]